MKETAKRFRANHEIVVQCFSFDLILSTDKTYITLYKDQAFWRNGSLLGNRSDVLIYYEAQRLEGIDDYYRKDGKRAEMAIGEGKTLGASHLSECSQLGKEDT